MSAGHREWSDFTLSFGAGASCSVGNRYGQFGPFGFNGGYYYTRVGFDWRS